MKLLSRILASVYDGNDSLLKSVKENKESNEYVRSAALDCLFVLFVVGVKSREEIISYFKKLFDGKLKGDLSSLWTPLNLSSKHVWSHGRQNTHVAPAKSSRVY